MREGEDSGVVCSCHPSRVGGGINEGEEVDCGGRVVHHPPVQAASRLVTLVWAQEHIRGEPTTALMLPILHGHQRDRYPLTGTTFSV